MIGFTDLVSAIRYRLRLVLIVGGLVFLAIAVLGFTRPRAYTASSSVLVDLTQRDPVSANSVTGSDNSSVLESVIGTQEDIIRSDAVLGEVIRRSPQFQSAKLGDTPAERTQNGLVMLRRDLAISNEKGSNVIRLSLTANTPEQAAKTLNLIVDTFLTKQVTLRSGSAQGNAKWYDARTRDVRDRLEAAQSRLSNFQRQHGIVGMNRMDVEADRVRNLSTELVSAQAAAAVAQSKSGSTAQPEVAQSTIVQDLQRESGLQAGKVAELSKTLGPNHPDMLAANAQLAALRSQLESARSIQAQALTASSSAAGRRESQIRADLAAQQTRMLALSGVQDQLNVLQRDVDAARATYDTVRQRYNEATLQSEVSQANASRLDRAVAPTLPSKPNLILWVIAAIVLGAGAGLASAIGQEMLTPRLRTPSGTARALDLDVIADMTDIESGTTGWRAPRKEAIA
ncbi:MULTISPECIES: GNVR domain-containing protein [unclassified Sphingomonas]|uniref:GNVR domain-containing protein n=1 Tax=unclassified Sphingomonas TaxID=196159 RepID=UPI0007023067|nr:MULTISPECIES: GNVR domain-containing protein [unclassified Sphingomonas]KQS48284.1 hypothetical protein ASG20_14360 [Sphingomonas sp. Leaf198]RMB34654.1 uncharacterized protein involved in exopolysaccharide biosynthesis [Sphingomonas sp. PP-F2F-G114-C0414]